MGTRIQCKNCKDVIESKYVHDWQCCSCFRNIPGNAGVYIDGGDEYCRIGGDVRNYEYVPPEDKDEAND